MRLRTFLAALALAASALAAEPRATKPLAESLTGAAKVSYDAGKLLFTDGDFAGASLKFRQAHEQSRDPRLLWNIAAAEKSLRHYAKAAEFTRRYLEEAKAIIGREQKENAEETLTAMLGFLGEIVVSAEPKDASVLIDGELRAGTGPSRSFTVDQGTRAVRVEKDGYDPFTKSVEVVGGAKVTVPVVLVRQSLMGKLAVIANDGASIEVDGQAVGTSRWGGELLPGPHAVRVTLAGKKAHQASVDITARSLRTVEVALEDENPAAAAPIAAESSTHWGWWVAGAVATGAAATVAYLLLAPTPAQGSRDPGTLGAVNLPLVAW
jgi:hypothetical protein